MHSFSYLEYVYNYFTNNILIQVEMNKRHELLSKHNINLLKKKLSSTKKERYYIENLNINTLTIYNCRSKLKYYCPDSSENVTCLLIEAADSPLKLLHYFQTIILIGKLS